MVKRKDTETPSGSNANDGKKTCVTMGNIWELRLSGLEYDRLDKAFSDHCKEKNITAKDFFLTCNDTERAAGWNEIVKKLPSDLVKTIASIMEESNSSGGAKKKTPPTTTETTNDTTTTTTTTTTTADTMTTTTAPPLTTTTPPPPPTTTTMTTPTTALPNPTNDIMFAGLFGLSDSEKKKFKKSQEKALRKVKHAIQINEENKELLREHRDLGIILTTPERKPAVIFEDDFRPGVELGDYVKVEGDSSPGNNRPAGYGFVTVVKGVGAATIASVKYSPSCYDNGRSHKMIPFTSMTPGCVRRRI
jgi:hypothetical protein